MLVADDLIGQVTNLKEAIVVDGNWDQVNVLVLALKSSIVGLHEPLYTNVTDCWLSKSTRPHSFIVLEHYEKLVTGQDFSDQSLSDVAFLDRLVSASLGHNVTRAFEKSVDHANMGSVLKITDTEGKVNTMCCEGVHENEEVSEGFVLWDKDDPLVFIHKAFDALYS